MNFHLNPARQKAGLFSKAVQKIHSDAAFADDQRLRPFTG
jgi:hypothetical protein